MLIKNYDVTNYMLSEKERFQNMLYPLHWQRWSAEYLTTLNKFCKWQSPTRNIKVGDVVILEDNHFFTKWPLTRVSEVYRGKDGLVEVATVKTAKGTYKRPVTKLAPLLVD